MLNENSENRAKTTKTHIKNNSKNYQIPPSNNFRDIYINQSPTYYNQYRYEQENKNPYKNQFHYLQKQKGPEDYYIEEDNLEKTMKIKLKPDFFFNEFNSMKDSMEKDNNYVERSVNTFTNKSPSKLGEKYYIINNKNKNESQNDRKILTYKEYGHQSYKGERIPQKFYRNSPIFQTSNYNNNIKLENGEDSKKPVAQKICNITIKGGIKKEGGKKLRSGKKRQKKNFMENMEFEGNFPQPNANAIPDKNINFNISATKSKLSSSSANYNDDENYEESENEEIENEEIEEKEEEMPISEERKMVEMGNNQVKTNKKRIYQKNGEEYNEEYEEEDEENLRNGETINKERDTLGEEQEVEGYNDNDNDNDEEIEIEEEGEQDEGTEQDYNKIAGRREKQEIEIEEGTEHNEEEQVEQGEQIEQLEDEDEENIEQMNVNEEIRNRIKVNKGDIEELEDEELQLNEMTNNTIKENENENKKDDELNLQKENEIKLEGKENNYINEQNDKNNSNNKRLNNTEIKVDKKPLYLQINEESKIELLKKDNKNQNLEQANSSNNKNKIYKKQIFNSIIKNKENNINAINKEEQKKDPVYKMQKIQNFVQPRDRIRKIKNQNQSIKYKIIKYKDSNFMLEKIYEEPELIIENVLFYEQYPNKKPKNRKKNRFTKIKIVKSKDGVLELLGNSVLSINKENNFFIPKIYNKRTYKKYNYNKFKPSKRTTYQYKPIEVINDAIISPKESRFMIKGKPKKINKKGRNIIKREIVYFYKSPIPQNNELSIGGNINNTILSSTSNSINSNLNINSELRNQSRFLNRNMIYNRKMQSESANTNNTYNTNTNSINVNSNNTSNTNKNSRPNLFNVYISKRSNIAEKKEEKKEEYKRREKNRTYKTTTIVSSNLEKNDNENEPVKQEYISIRRKYTNSRSNKNILVEQPENKKITNRFFRRSPGYHVPSSNDCSKDKEITAESNNNTKNLRYTVGKTSITNFMSPRRNEETTSSENKNDNNKVIIGRNNIIISKYEQYNKNQLIKSENSNIGKIRPYFSNKNKNEVPKTPLTKQNNDNNNNYNSNSNNRSYYNNYRNKSHTITIFSNKQETKNVGRTYISSNKNLKRNPSNEKEKTDNKDNNNDSNMERIYVSTTYNFKKSNNNQQIENQKLGTNIIINSLYVNKNLKKEKNDIKNEDKTEKTDRTDKTDKIDKIDKTDKTDKKDKTDKIDKIETKIENKNKELSNNSVYYSSFTTKKQEPKQFNNNQIFISTKSTSSGVNKLKDKEKDKDKDNRNEIKININRILVNSSDNSPTLVKSVDNSLSPKPEPNNMNKIFNNNNTFFSSNLESKNKNIFEKEKNIENDKINDNKINDNDKDKNKDNNNDKDDDEKDLIKNTSNEEIKIENKNEENIENTPEKNNDNSNDINNDDNEDKNEENINIFDKFNYGGNSQLSDFSKNYLNNYISTSRPELSDFSKQFLTSNYTSNSTNRPELSNITRAYLISRSPVVENDDNK